MTSGTLRRRFVEQEQCGFPSTSSPSLLCLFPTGRSSETTQLSCPRLSCEEFETTLIVSILNLEVFVPFFAPSLLVLRKHALNACSVKRAHNNSRETSHALTSLLILCQPLHFHSRLNPTFLQQYEHSFLAYRHSFQTRQSFSDALFSFPLHHFNFTTRKDLGGGKALNSLHLSLSLRFNK